MAEKAVAGQMLAIRYSYANLPSGEKPDGATVFKYQDMQAHLKVLRQAYYEHYGVRGQIRYVVCGERGSNGTQRSHYHVLLFTDKPLGPLGEWFHAYTHEVLEGETKPLNTDINWSLWPHGHIHMQEPAAKGVFYVLKYVFKDMMTSEKAQGTKHEKFSLVYAASIFRMSKKPPIGMRFVVELLDRHAKIGTVPPSLQFSVPDYAGYYYPTGVIREYALQRCHEINRDYRLKNGRDCPTWEALVSSLSKPNTNEPENDKEALLHGQIEEQPPTKQELELEFQQFAAQLAHSERIRASRAILKHCGHILPCKECRITWSPEQNRELEADENKWFDKWAAKNGKHCTSQTVAEFREWWLKRYRPSRGCRRRNEDEVFNAFKSANALKVTAKRITGPSEDETGRNAKDGGKPRLNL